MREKLQWVLAIVASMALGGAVVVGIDSATSDGGSGSTTVIERISDSSGSSVSQSVSDVADLYDRLRPSVVRVRTGNGSGLNNGVGSGVVLDKEGRILTNNHVVNGARSVDVTFWNGRSVAARLLGTDPGNDLAVIDVDVPADQLHPVTLGDSAKVRVGEFVVAIGNPFDIEGTLTQGIVSGVGRTLGGGAGKPLRQLIQSDAAINPGNSGGGLFNARGELIGITTALENPSGDRVFVGVGYAVPVNTARRFLPDMIAGAAIQHPRLGVVMQPLTPALAETLGLKVEQGVLIIGVEANSAADKAGLRGSRSGGDVVVAIDDQQVKDIDDLGNYIDSKQVGDKVKVKIVRGGNEMTVDVTLEAWRNNAA
jgi:S1-C subfamily serine protease